MNDILQIFEAFDLVQKVGPRHIKWKGGGFLSIRELSHSTNDIRYEVNISTKSSVGSKFFKSKHRFKPTKKIEYTVKFTQYIFNSTKDVSFNTISNHFDWNESERKDVHKTKLSLLALGLIE